MNHTCFYCGCTVSQSVPHERATLASTLECSCLASVAIDSARDGRTPHDRRVVGDMPCTCTDSTVRCVHAHISYMHATRGREASPATRGLMRRACRVCMHRPRSARARLVIGRPSWDLLSAVGASWPIGVRLASAELIRRAAHAARGRRRRGQVEQQRRKVARLRRRWREGARRR